MFLDIALLDSILGLACQNYQLAHNIHSAEVDTRIGLGITRLARHTDRLAQRHIGAHNIENVVERTRHNRLNARNAVATLNE